MKRILLVVFSLSTANAIFTAFPCSLNGNSASAFDSGTSVRMTFAPVEPLKDYGLCNLSGGSYGSRQNGFPGTFDSSDKTGIGIQDTESFPAKRNRITEFA